MIPVAQPIIAPKQELYVTDCIKKNWLSWKGEYVERFEEEFAKFVGAKYAVMVSSGTAALEIAYQIALEAGRNKLILPNFSFIATLSAAIRAGYKQIEIVDIDLDDLAITRNLHPHDSINTAICIVPISGLINWEKRIANQNDFYIIDAAQALGTKIDFHKVNIATYSFFANKFISTGEGGMIVSNYAYVADYAKQWRSLPSFEYSEDTSYPLYSPQTNSRPTNIQAAIGLAQLEIVKEKFEHHYRVYEAYREWFTSSAILQEKLKLQTTHEINQVPWTTRFRILPISLTKEIRTTTGASYVAQLKIRNIEAKPFYTPFAQHPLAHEYMTASQVQIALDNTQLLHGFYLPTHQEIKDEHIEYIMKALEDICKTLP